MPLQYGEIQIGTVILQPEPFEWPRNPWEVLELRITEEMGWATLDASALNTLKGYYNNARGRVEFGVSGAVVQFFSGYASQVVTVADWRGNTGQFVFVPNDGIEVEEIAGSGQYYTGTLRLVRVG